MAKQNAPRLGKGLNAIIGSRRQPASANTPKPASEITPAEVGTIRSLPIDSVVPNPHQPRSAFDDVRLAELSASIAEQGMIQPVVVRPTETGKYELIAGERRWRAARAAAIEEIPAIIRDATDAEALELALVENLQREDLNPIERATAYQRYLDTFGATAEQLASRLGESRANVANYLRLLGLAPGVRDMIEQGELGMGQARAIAGIADPHRQLAVASLAVRRNLSVRQVEALARRRPGEEAADAKPSGASNHFVSVQRALSKSLGLAVTLQPGRKKNAGRIIIRYNSLEEFDRVAERLCGDAALE